MCLLVKRIEEIRKEKVDAYIIYVNMQKFRDTYSYNKSVHSSIVRSMDSLQDMLRKRPRNEPPEVPIIKEYVQSRFGAAAGVMVREREIVITVGNASLVGALRMQLPELTTLCRPDKRIVLRIGRV